MSIKARSPQAGARAPQSTWPSAEAIGGTEEHSINTRHHLLQGKRREYQTCYSPAPRQTTSDPCFKNTSREPPSPFFTLVNTTATTRQEAKPG